MLASNLVGYSCDNHDDGGLGGGSALVFSSSAATGSAVGESSGPICAIEGGLVKLRALGKDLPSIEYDQSKAVHHELVVAHVKATLKELEDTPFNGGHIGSKMKSQASIDEVSYQ